jgi:hypothetical protein
MILGIHFYDSLFADWLEMTRNKNKRTDTQFWKSRGVKQFSKKAAEASRLMRFQMKGQLERQAGNEEPGVL